MCIYICTCICMYMYMYLYMYMYMYLYLYMYMYMYTYLWILWIRQDGLSPTCFLQWMKHGQSPFSPIITDLVLLFSAAQNCHRVTFAGRARGGDYGKGEGLLADSILYKFEDSTLFTTIVLGRSKEQQKAGEGQILDSGIMWWTCDS